MFEAVCSAVIKIVWIACTNPAQSLPDQKLVREALKKAAVRAGTEKNHSRSRWNSESRCINVVVPAKAVTPFHSLAKKVFVVRMERSGRNDTLRLTEVPGTIDRAGRWNVQFVVPFTHE
jgi:hypothetical protein